MTVVADSSCVNYLVLISEIQILPKLFGHVLVPEAVARELRSPGAPRVVAQWIADRPDWLRVEGSHNALSGEGLESLGAGEREAIALALAHRADVLLLIDEVRGRREAERRQIRFMGTLGILDIAAAKYLIDLPCVIERLLQTSFYLTPTLLKTLLENDARRNRTAP